MINIPYVCPRKRNDCIALSNIISDDGESFFCCGENNGKNTEIKQDIYTVCFKGPHDDRISYNDRLDLTHNAAVIVQALAATEKNHGDNNDWSPWNTDDDGAP